MTSKNFKILVRENIQSMLTQQIREIVRETKANCKSMQKIIKAITSLFLKFSTTLIFLSNQFPTIKLAIPQMELHIMENLRNFNNLH